MMNAQPQIPVINENIKYLDRIIQTPPTNNDELRIVLNRIIQMSQEEKMEFTKEINDIIALIKRADAIDISSSDFLKDPEFLPVLQQRVGDTYITNLLQTSTKSEDLSVKTKVEPPKKLLTETDKKLVLGDITKINGLLNTFSSISTSNYREEIKAIFNEVPNILRETQVLISRIDSFSLEKLRGIIDTKHHLDAEICHIDKTGIQGYEPVNIQKSLRQFLIEWDDYKANQQIILDAWEDKFPKTETVVNFYRKKDVFEFFEGYMKEITDLINNKAENVGEKLFDKIKEETDELMKKFRIVYDNKTNSGIINNLKDIKVMGPKITSALNNLLGKMSMVPPDEIKKIKETRINLPIIVIRTDENGKETWERIDSTMSKWNSITDKWWKKFEINLDILMSIAKLEVFHFPKSLSK